MAKMRTIDPEFHQSVLIGKLSRDARLLFLELFTLADDYGRLRGDAHLLSSILYPFDDLPPKLVEGWIAELRKQRLVRRYEVDSTIYIEVLDWQKMQRITRPAKPRYPAPPAESLPSPDETETVRKEEEKKEEEEGYDSTGEQESLELVPDMVIPLSKPAPRERPAPAYGEYLTAWNENKGENLPRLSVLGKSRINKLRIRIGEGLTIDRFRQAVKICSKTPFLHGKNERGWRADFDWLIANDRNMDRVLGGKYGDAEDVKREKPVEYWKPTFDTPEQKARHEENLRYDRWLLSLGDQKLVAAANAAEKKRVDEAVAAWRAKNPWTAAS
jgi:hypothetical protein